MCPKNMKIKQNRERYNHQWHFRLLALPLDVLVFEYIAESEYSGTAHTTHDVCAGALEERRGALVLEHLLEAVHGTVVLDTTSTGHHHSSSNGVDGVTAEAGERRHHPTEEERQEGVWLVAEKDWLERVVESKVHASVDEDANARDYETSVETGNTIGGNCFAVDIDKSVELAFATLALGIVCHSSSCIVQRVHKHKRKRTSKSTTSNVSTKLDNLRGIFLHSEHRLDRVLEGKVQRLGRKVSDNVSQVTTPEASNSLGFHRSSSAVNDAVVRLIESALLDHLVLVLDEKLDSLDGRRGGLGHAGCDARNHKVFKKVEVGHPRKSSFVGEVLVA